MREGGIMVLYICINDKKIIKRTTAEAIKIITIILISNILKVLLCMVTSDCVQF